MSGLGAKSGAKRLFYCVPQVAIHWPKVSLAVGDLFSGAKRPQSVILPAVDGISFPGAKRPDSDVKRLYNTVDCPKAERVPHDRRFFFIRALSALSPTHRAKRLFYCPPPLQTFR